MGLPHIEVAEWLGRWTCDQYVAGSRLESWPLRYRVQPCASC